MPLRKEGVKQNVSNFTDQIKLSSVVVYIPRTQILDVYQWNFEHLHLKVTANRCLIWTFSFYTPEKVVEKNRTEYKTARNQSLLPLPKRSMGEDKRFLL